MLVARGATPRYISQGQNITGAHEQESLNSSIIRDESNILKFKFLKFNSAPDVTRQEI
jgi:hypothetical protein